MGYNVTYGPASEIERSMTVVVSDYLFTAVGLLFDTRYIFEVRALSREYGYGPPACITVSTSSLQGKLLIDCYM